MRKLIDRFLFDAVHLILVRGAGFLQDMPDLRDRDDGEELGEEEITGEEQTESAEIETYFRPLRAIICPATGDPVAVSRRNDNHETLEPHTDVHHDRHNEGKRYITA